MTNAAKLKAAGFKQEEVGAGILVWGRLIDDGAKVDTLTAAGQDALTDVDPVTLRRIA